MTNVRGSAGSPERFSTRQVIGRVARAHPGLGCSRRYPGLEGRHAGSAGTRQRRLAVDRRRGADRIVDPAPTDHAAARGDQVPVPVRAAAEGQCEHEAVGDPSRRDGRLEERAGAAPRVAHDREEPEPPLACEGKHQVGGGTGDSEQEPAEARVAGSSEGCGSSFGPVLSMLRILRQKDSMLCIRVK